MKQVKSINLSGDGRCGSPGHNATYKIGAFFLTQVTEAENFNRMERMGFEKALKSLKDEGVVPEQIATDRHAQVRKYLKEEEPNITHQFDVWHFAKNIKKCKQKIFL